MVTIAFRLLSRFRREMESAIATLRSDRHNRLSAVESISTLADLLDATETLEVTIAFRLLSRFRHL